MYRSGVEALDTETLAVDTTPPPLEALVVLTTVGEEATLVGETGLATEDKGRLGVLEDACKVSEGDEAGGGRAVETNPVD